MKKFLGVLSLSLILVTSTGCDCPVMRFLGLAPSEQGGKPVVFDEDPDQKQGGKPVVFDEDPDQKQGIIIEKKTEETPTQKQSQKQFQK